MNARRAGIAAVWFGVAVCWTAPALAANSNGIAVIIGNRDYRGAIPTVDFAVNDADAFREFTIRVLGFEPGNILDLRNASEGEMRSAFGTSENHRGRLWRMLDPAGNSDVVVFFSGHGVPGLNDRRAYLLPVDADPNVPEINGYPLDTLYENLGQMNARSVMVFIDACFSGQSFGGPLIQASGLGVSPTVPSGDGALVSLAAAQADQVAVWDAETRHGLFTRFLLEALYGAADGRDTGNGDGDVTLSEVKAYLDMYMTRTAQGMGRDQTAVQQGAGERVLAALGAYEKDAEIARLREKMAEAESLLSEARAEIRELRAGADHAAFALDIRNIAPTQEREGEELNLIITGEITNLTGEPQAIPRLRAAILDAQSRELFAWTFESPWTEIGAGQTTGFTTRVPNPPENARGVAVTFLDELAQAQAELTEEQRIRRQSQQQVTLLEQQLLSLREQMQSLEAALLAAEAREYELQSTIETLGQRLNASLAKRVEELARAEEIPRFRAEMFERLRTRVGSHPDVTVVGDRFVFQSEELFNVGTTVVRTEGQLQLAILASLVIEIAEQIPDDIDWVLHVDGHTDARPISTPAFSSNWELSTARAVSVVRFLISRGVPQNRLAATGFGEFQPLDERLAEDAYRRNRRIEINLAQR